MAGLKKIDTNNSMQNGDFDKVVGKIEDENIRNLNDEIEVSDDGYVHDVKMLAGYVDKDGTLHDTFSYREMNGKDEEAINKADIRQNGAKMVNVLVERCVTQIGTLTKKECGAKWGTIIRELLGGDLDYMAFKIRELSKGKEVEFAHKCPNCGTKLNTVVSTDEFNINPYLGQSTISFSLVRGYRDAKGELHKEGTIRLPNGVDREIVTPLFRKNVSTAMTMLLTRLVTFNDGAYVTQNLVNEMTLRDREILEKIIKENTFGVDTNFELVCSSCGQDISGEVGQSNFL